MKRIPKRIISLLLALVIVGACYLVSTYLLGDETNGNNDSPAVTAHIPDDPTPDPSSVPGKDDPETPPVTPDDDNKNKTPDEPIVEPIDDPADEPEETPEAKLPADGVYTSRDDVALYIHQYGHLPDNFITKKEAEKLGWSGGSLEPYAKGKCIGGTRFGNYEGLLPDKDGRVWTECDIDTLGASSRGAKRIVFSNDGLIYYTDDHYESFTLLYGEE